MPSLRPKLHHTSPSWVASGATFFVTICAANRGGTPLTQNEKIASRLLEAVAAYHARRWWCRLWLIMPDHVHGLVNIPPDGQLARTIGDWKRFTAKTCAIEWQENFFDHRLRNHESLEEKAAYIRANPVRAGLVAQPDAWLWIWEPAESSAEPVT